MNKVKVFDVFSGAGGFSCGFEMAGCTVVGAVEHDKWAADTFTFNHDFVIGATINAEFKCKGKENSDLQSFDMPAIAIECKTYLDKTMLESCSTTGEQLKKNNPNALYIVVAERLKLSEAVNLKNCKIDQIYILRKQKNTDREDRFLDGYIANPIYEDVVFHLFAMVRDYLAADWGGKIADGLQRGYLI